MSARRMSLLGPPGAGEGRRSPRPVDCCRNRGGLAEVDGVGSVEEVAKRIEEALS